MERTFIKPLLFTSVILNYGIATAKNNSISKDFEPNQSNSISFTENKGQVHDQNYNPRPDVLFGGESNGLVFHLRNNGISYQLNKIDSWKEVEDLKTKSKKKEVDKSTIYRLDINWLNANADASIIKGKALEGYSNFYLASCPDGATNVKSYTDVTYKNIYSGIDLKWYEKNGELKYDYLCAAGADYKNIQLKIEGAESISLNKKGELLLKTPLGTIIEKAPTVLQNGKTLPSKWVIKNYIISFDIENLDKQKEFVIDPAVRVWGTYYGGIANDAGFSCTTDATSNVYLSGTSSFTTSINIATIGSHQSIYGSGSNDAFLVKFNSDGVRQWGTYYGGAGNEDKISCAASSSGDVYLSGTSTSSIGTIIATGSGHQSNYGGGSEDAFLVKFDSFGLRQWGTYYGGTGIDYGYSCCVDISGNVYLAGYSTSSSTAIATSGSHQSFYYGSGDAFLVKFDASGIRLWGTYYGGNNGENGLGCTTDVSGNVYLTGLTGSTISIASPGCHQSVLSAGGPWSSDAYLVKFNGNGVRQWATYYGGSGNDEGYSCVADASGNVYLAGLARSVNGAAIIATSGSHQSSFGGIDDAFLVKFNSTGARQWGTYYGGSSTDNGQSCATDALGNIYLVGYSDSNSGTVIATPGSHQSISGGSNEAFLVMFNTSGVRQWGTYYGGGSSDFGRSCTIDPLNNIYVAGRSTSSTGAEIASPTSHQPIYGGAGDAFLVKFKDCFVLNPNALSNGTICSGASINFTANITGTTSPTYFWQGPSGFTSSIQNPIISNANITNNGTYTLTVNSGSCAETATTGVIVNASPSPSIQGVASICNGSSSTLTASGGSAYLWSNSVISSSIVVSPTISTLYSVTVTNTSGCNTNVSQAVTVNANPTITVNSGAICIGNNFTITPSGASTYTIQGGGAIKNPTSNTSYTVTGTSSAGCLATNIATSNVTVNPNPTITATSNTSLICIGAQATLTAGGASTYSWSTGATAQSISVSPSITTSYTVIGTLLGTGCQNVSIITQSVSTCTGIGNKDFDNNSSFTVYPNPTSNNINIHSEAVLEKVEIANAIGQIVLTKNNIKTTNTIIDLSQLPAGIYFVQLYNTNKLVIKK